MMKNFALVFVACVLTVTTAEAAKKKKSSSYSTAKKECLSEDPSLKGKALHSCVKEKRK